MLRRAWIGAAVGLAMLLAGAGAAQERPANAEPPWQAFLVAGGQDRRAREAALDEIAARWRDSYAAMIVDVARFLPPTRGPRGSDDPVATAGFEDPDVEPGRPGGGVPELALQAPGADIRRRLISFLERQTGQRFGDDLRAWRKWYWALPPAPHADYAAFKGELYSRIDPRFRAFFPPGVQSTIRLDEIDWGGVPINGIPPLRAPKHTPASGAGWLRDGHIVFGIVVNGEARAYPKRILAWHEMATDTLGGVDLTIVYCTLCGTVIPYESVVEGRKLTFGTSGLLYRSNKLMFDEETASLWSSLEGVPVVGPLVGFDVRLNFHAVVTTTWGEWRRDHPETTVLSLDTGFERDYGEGAAYREYFRHDRLMFEVPATDNRLKNKDEVVVLRPEVLGEGARAVAISVDRLAREPVFAFEAAGRPLVVITSRQGANRVYERGAHRFSSTGRDGGVRDAEGRRWTPTAEALVSETGERLAAVPVHRAFWFGWFAQYPDTELIK
ncbi:MAG: DUF3179 domain-containing protein [Acidobacteriota bacterium]